MYIKDRPTPISRRPHNTHKTHIETYPPTPPSNTQNTHTGRAHPRLGHGRQLPLGGLRLLQRLPPRLARRRACARAVLVLCTDTMNPCIQSIDSTATPTQPISKSNNSPSLPNRSPPAAGAAVAAAAAAAAASVPPPCWGATSPPPRRGRAAAAEGPWGAALVRVFVFFPQGLSPPTNRRTFARLSTNTITHPSQRPQTHRRARRRVRVGGADAGRGAGGRRGGGDALQH